MYTSTIDEFNNKITKFIQEISKYEDLFIAEAPDVWEGVLLSVSTLSKITVFLEAAKVHELEDELAFFNKMLEANNMSRSDKLPTKLAEVDVDLSKYRTK